VVGTVTKIDNGEGRLFSTSGETVSLRVAMSECGKAIETSIIMQTKRMRSGACVLWYNEKRESVRCVEILRTKKSGPEQRCALVVQV
jgi:hypothetical protein